MGLRVDTLVYRGKDYTNTWVYDWLVLRVGPYKIIGESGKPLLRARQTWIARCRFCNEEHEVFKYDITEGKSKSCYKCRGNRIRGENSSLWKGEFGIPLAYFNQIKANATKGNRNFEFTVTMEYLGQLFVEQGGRCALTGLPLEIHGGNEISQRTTRRRSASIDRINPEVGYVPGNVQWVHKDVNSMKSDFTQEYFLEICRLVANNSKSGACEIA